MRHHKASQSLIEPSKGQQFVGIFLSFVFGARALAKALALTFKPFLNDGKISFGRVSDVSSFK